MGNKCAFSDKTCEAILAQNHSPPICIKHAFEEGIITNCCNTSCYSIIIPGKFYHSCPNSFFSKPICAECNNGSVQCRDC